MTAVLGMCQLEGMSQVVINEFCIANYTDFDLGGGWGGTYEDWVEFYNPTGADIDLEGFHLSDDPADPMKFEIPSVNVPANGYALIVISAMFDEDPWAWGYMNTSFKITQTNDESLVFSDGGGAIIEQYTFGDNVVPNQMNHSWARTDDGGLDWKIHTNPSPEASNGGPFGAEYAATPVLDVQAGYYAGGTQVSISSPQAGVDIYYTLNGNEPDDGDMLYTGPIDIDETTVLKAVAYHPDADILPSFAETNTYFVGDDNHTIPIFSVSGPTLDDGSWNGDELMVIEMFDEDGNFIVEGHGDSNEHGNDSNAYDQRGFDYITRDQMGHDHELDHEIFHQHDRDRYERLIFKAAANDNYCFQQGAHMRDLYCHEISTLAGLDLDVRHGIYCIVYINGTYWGVYDVREKVDDIDYTWIHYQQPRHFVDFIKTWGGTWEEYGPGCLNDWNDLKDFILGNDMTDPDNYAFVQDQYSTNSLIDYFVLNGYVVSMDWLNWNTAWWRGRHPDGQAKKWKYVLWDMDATFGHYVNYTGIPDTSPEADPCNPEALGDPGGQGHVPILNALLENESFWADYINRYAALSNTYFTCDYMIDLVDSFAMVIDAEMPRQCVRWPQEGGTYDGWQGELQDLRDFILERCSDEFVSGMEDCYDVEPVTVTIIIDGIGEVIIGTTAINQNWSPFEGIFYAGVPLDLEAFTDIGLFLSWEVIEGDETIDDLTDPNITIDLLGDVTIIAHFANNLDPQNVMFDIDPPGAGIINLDGQSTAPYPNTILVDGGLHVIEATENEWFVFDHWEVLNGSINPDMDDPDGTFFVSQTDTVVAFYNEIPHWEVTVDVEPQGAGTITIAGTPLASYPWTGELEGELDLTFVTSPTDIWNEFSHWEINNHVVTPDEFSSTMVINLTAEDHIVAVYNVIPHWDITVIVDPPYAGTVSIDNQVIVTDEWTGVMEGDLPTPFIASPQPFWTFTGWKSTSHVASPNNLERNVVFSLMESDTIIASFEPEPFGIYVPNSFTPNNDGKNDYFLPVGSAIDGSDYYLKIFNRWGEMVFETDNPAKGWNGSHGQGDYYVKDEVYVYSMRIKSVHEIEPQEYMGHIMVFR